MFVGKQALASSQGSPYRIAIDLTSDTVTQRARNYKTLILSIVLTGAASAIWAVWSETLTPLCGILLFIPLCGIFSYHDSIVVGRWESQLLLIWAERQLDFSALTSVFHSLPTLPQQTVNSMLASVLFTNNLQDERKISLSTRKAMATVSKIVSTCRSDAIALNVLSHILIVISIIIASTIGAWQPLLMATPALAQWPLRSVMMRLRLRHASQRLATDRQNPDFDIEVYRAFIIGFQENIILDSMRARFL